MKKKLLCAILACISAVCMLFAIGCGGHEHSAKTSWASDGTYHWNPCVVSGCETQLNKTEHSWDGGTVTRAATKNLKGQTTYRCQECSKTKTEDNIPFVAPTAAEVYSARQAVIDNSIEGYNFNFGLTCDLELLGLGAQVSGDYDGQYRYNKSTNEEQFKRTTSGSLFFDSTFYSYTKDSQKIKITAKKDGTVKKSSVVRMEEENTFFINKAVVALVNAIQESTLIDVKVAPQNVDYEYQAKLNFGANNPKIAQITSLFAKFESKVAFKNIEFTNPLAIPFYFNINDNNELQDFKLMLDINIEIKSVSVGVSIEYSQEEAHTAISVPKDNTLIVSNTQIASELSYINGSLNSLKQSDDYSLDIVAKNEFDPGWTKLATVDKYSGRMYKNTDGNDVWFNHSYEYKIHHVDDGGETYKYTLGNIKDGSVHLVSRKGNNSVAEVTGFSADTQFDYFVSPFIFTANDVDCIKKTTKNNETTYSVHVNDACALSIQDKIIDIINSIDEDDIIDVNNYMNTNVTIKDAEFIITFVDGAISKINIKTDLKYNPTSGEYTDYNITLTNELELLVNDKLSNASDYVAPSSSTGNILGLEAAKFYIN